MPKSKKRQDPKLSEPPKNESFEPAPHHEKIKGYKKCKAEVDAENLKFYSPKRIEAGILKLKLNEFDYLQMSGRYVKAASFKKDLIAIGSANNIHTLDLDLSGTSLQTYAGLRFLCHTLRRLSSLKNLSLDFQQCNAITDAGIQQICQTLKTLSRLQKIAVNLEGCQWVTCGGFTNLSRTLRTISSLRRIDLNFFRRASGIANGVVCSLNKALMRSSLLQELKLKGWDKNDDTGLQRLGQTLKRLISLRSINLDLGTAFSKHVILQRFTETGIESLSQAFKSLTLLRKIDLNLSGCNFITAKTMLNLGQALESLNSLEYLRLNFFQCVSLDDTALSQLGEVVTKLKSLKSVGFGFSSCPVLPDKGGISLGEAFKLIPSLQDIRLLFSYCQITDQALSPLVQEFKSIHSLQSLHLNFSGNPNISDSRLEEFSQNLGQLTWLKELNLYFSNCVGMSDKSRKPNLYLGLKKLKELQTLSLHLSSIKLLTLTGVNHIGTVLSAMTSLRNLNLNFSHCQNIDKEGMSHLCQGLQKCASLQSLSLNFASCDFHDAAANILWKALKNLTSLQQIKLNLLNCYNIFQKGTDSFCEAFQKLDSLKDIEIEFPYFQSEDIVLFGKTLKTLDSLETIRIPLATYSSMGKEAKIVRQTLRNILRKKRISC